MSELLEESITEAELAEKKETLKLIDETHNITYVNSKGEEACGSLLAAVDRMYGKYLNFDGKETVLYGIATIFHREGVERAVMRISEGETIYSNLDRETKWQMIKLNQMKFVDYREDGVFRQREFKPEEFCLWLLFTGSSYSKTYRLKGRSSPLLDRSLEILKNIVLSYRQPSKKKHPQNHN